MNSEFVAEFNRLAGTRIGRSSSPSPIASLVDEATGYRDLKEREELIKFLAFVHETVWKRLPDGVRDPNQHVEPPEGQSFHDLFLND